MSTILLVLGALPLAFLFGWFWYAAARLVARWRTTLIMLPVGLAVFGAGFWLRESPAGAATVSTGGYTAIVLLWIAAGVCGLLLRMRRASRLSRRNAAGDRE
ncbi:hypothetical protein [Brevibacterium luteolum]|uniref:Uncharacterized protein n=1 Tax=Brevibacterium luteolum TaxID=199591 RepID=A0A849B0C8_9MICO|nr:hypothetical protein [Brevibacterium luteolum]MBM7529994.1 hypothetical protein [Brevibacterium luteolum]NNG78746.1 hypothetical protein [Brevibacterium luteolum]